MSRWSWLGAVAATGIALAGCAGDRTGRADGASEPSRDPVVDAAIDEMEQRVASPDASTVAAAVVPEPDLTPGIANRPRDAVKNETATPPAADTPITSPVEGVADARPVTPVPETAQVPQEDGRVVGIMAPGIDPSTVTAEDTRLRAAAKSSEPSEPPAMMRDRARERPLPPITSAADRLTLARAGLLDPAPVTESRRPERSPVRAVATSTRPAAARSSAAVSPDSLAAQEQAALAALAMVNAARGEAGYRPLEYSAELSAIARDHVIELAAREEVTSLDTEGNGIGIRLSDRGFTPRVAGSLVAGGYTTFERALRSWMSDEVQRSRLMLPDAQQLGIAAITDRRSTYGTYIEAIVAGD